MRHLALELVGLWVGLGLSFEMEAFGRALPMELGLPWWSKVLDLGLLPWGSGLTPYCSNRTSQATQHRRKNSKTDGESNTQEPRTPKETQTLIKKKEGKKRIKTGVKKKKKKKIED